MRIDVKSHNKNPRRFFLAINITLAALFVILFVVFLYFSGADNDDMAKTVGIVFLSVFALFVVINFTAVSVIIMMRKKMAETLKGYIAHEQYDNAMEYLRQICQKSRMYSTTQIIYFYLGYIELLRDHVDDAKSYLAQFDLDRLDMFTAYCGAVALALLHIVYSAVGDYDAYSNIRAKYEKKKDFCLRAVRSDAEIVQLFYAIDCLNSNNIELAKSKLQNCRYFKIPLVQRFVAK